MISILIVTHGQFGIELLKTAELILGKQEQAVALSLNADDSVDYFENKVKKQLVSLNKGDGILIFVDILGGTPSNILLKHIGALGFPCISGVNLPMLIEAFSNRSALDINDLVHTCIKIGSLSINTIRID